MCWNGAAPSQRVQPLWKVTSHRTQKYCGISSLFFKRDLAGDIWKFSEKKTKGKNFLNTRTTGKLSGKTKHKNHEKHFIWRLSIFYTTFKPRALVSLLKKNNNKSKKAGGGLIFFIITEKVPFKFQFSSGSSHFFLTNLIPKTLKHTVVSESFFFVIKGTKNEKGREAEEL